MKRIISASSLSILTLALVLGILCGKLLDRQPTQAAQSAVEWEYCAITGIESPTAILEKGRRAAIYHFQPDGARKENGSLAPNDFSAFAQAVAKLGADGWELVSAGAQLNPATAQGDILYFKRPKK